MKIFEYTTNGYLVTQNGDAILYISDDPRNKFPFEVIPESLHRKQAAALVAALIGAALSECAFDDDVDLLAVQATMHAFTKLAQE